MEGAPRNRGVCGEIGQHRGHVGMDHSRALGHPANGNQATADAVLQDDGFRAQIGCHDRPSGIQASTVAELNKQLRYALDDSIDR